MNSHRGYMDNIYDYGEDVVCCISDKNEMEKIISSLILYL